MKLRAYLDRIKPIDARMKYQVDKLLKSSGRAAASSNSDLLQLKPNPAGLGAATLPAEDEEAAQEVAGEEGKPGVYKPPKLVPAFYEEDGAEPSGAAAVPC